jgi:hypothetical protein
MVAWSGSWRVGVDSSLAGRYLAQFGGQVGHGHVRSVLRRRGVNAKSKLGEAAENYEIRLRTDLFRVLGPYLSS